MDTKYQQGDKVVPLRKTVGHRSFDNSATYYRRLELNLPFLVVRGFAVKESQSAGHPVYWCEAIPHGGTVTGNGGDLYAETDLKPFTE